MTHTEFAIIIIIYIMLTFSLFYYFNVEIEGACTSRQFYSNKPRDKNKETSGLSSGRGDDHTNVNNMINTYIDMMDEIEKSMKDIKSKIPVKFNLGVVNNVDTTSNVTIHGTLPNVFLNFSIKNPPQGVKGDKGENAPTGPIGPTGQKGTVGYDGYWGTTKDTIF